VVGLCERAWTYGYAYKAVYMGISLSVYKGSLYGNFFNISRFGTYVFLFFVVLVFS